jgi:hypothetical protein
MDLQNKHDVQSLSIKIQQLFAGHKPAPSTVQQAARQPTKRFLNRYAAGRTRQEINTTHDPTWCVEELLISPQTERQASFGAACSTCWMRSTSAFSRSSRVCLVSTCRIACSTVV